MTASALLEGGPEARTERAFPALDGVRALAATAVVATHAAFWTGSYTPDLLGRAFARLDVGVAIFFVLSGFLLSRPLFLAAVEGRPGPRPAAYLWRRGLRILPAYWLTVVAAFLLLPGNRSAGVWSWVRHLTLIQSYGPGWFAEGVSHTWSLGAEVAFYLVLPLAAPGLGWLGRRRPERPARTLLALAVAAVLGLVWLGWVWGAGPFRLPFDLWLPGFAGWFGAGMAIAVLSVSDRDWGPVRVARSLGSSTATCWTAAGALFWIATSTVAGPEGLVNPTAAQAITRSLLYLGVASLVVLPLVFGEGTPGWGRSVLASPVARFLGEISYGLFLVHVLVLAVGYRLLGLAPFTGNLVLILLGTWVVGVALAAAVYVLVERPVRRWRALVPDRRRGSANAATTSALTATSTSA